MAQAQRADAAAADDRPDGGRRRLAGWIPKLRRHPQASVRDRLQRVRANLVLAIQAGVAAALAWVVAHEVIGNPEPVFAPIAAVGTLAASVGQRLRRTAELVLGVALGIGAADLLIVTLGTGPWQLGLIVVLAIVVAIFVGAGPGGVTQAAATGVLVAVLAPRVQDLEFSRVVDALVGGAVGLTVFALLLPINPLRVVERAARPALDDLADQLDATARALERRDERAAQEALDNLQELRKRLSTLDEAISGGRETATLAPVRWHRRAALTQYVESAEYIEYAAGNAGALIRRSVTALEDEEPIPPPLPAAVTLLAESVRLLHCELAAGREPEEARQKALEAATAAGRAYDEGVGFSGSVVVAQVRTTASDLIRATGVRRAEANRMVRHAVGSHRNIETKPTAGASAASGTSKASGAAVESGESGDCKASGASTASRPESESPRDPAASARGPAPYPG